MKKLENDKGWEVSYQELITYKKNIEEDYHQELINKLREGMVEGSVCSCCGRTAKVQARKLNASKLKPFIHLYFLSGGKANVYFHTRDIYKYFKTKSYNLGQLKYWGLIIQGKGTSEDDNPKDGYTCLTDLGVKFFQGKITMQRTLWIFNDEIRMDLAPNNFKQEMVRIGECMTDYFNYRKDVLETNYSKS